MSKEIAVVLVSKLKFHMSTYMDKLLCNRDLAKASVLTGVENTISDLSEDLKKLTNSTLAISRKE